MWKIFITLVIIQSVRTTPIPKTIIGHRQNSIENINLLKSGNYKQNAEELSGQFEGDIILNAEQFEYIFGSQRTGLINESYRWPGNTLAYDFAPNYFTQAQKDYIEKGLKQIENVTCIKFVRRTNQVDYVELTGLPDGCYSEVGRQGGKQQLNLALYEPGNGCFRLGTIMHEFIHALGFYHSQSATERDSYVRIMWEHIIEGLENNFYKYDANTITNFGVEYDVTSVMHYGAYAFTSNGYATIIPNDISLINILGQRNELTKKDIMRLNAMYECEV